MSYIKVSETATNYENALFLGVTIEKVHTVTAS
jgi:hypothetical protein